MDKREKLLLIFIQEGFVTVTMRSIFSSWIKQTVLLDYQSSNSDSQDPYIEAHITSMSVSLVSKVGSYLSEYQAPGAGVPTILHHIPLGRCSLAIPGPIHVQIGSCRFSSACSQYLCMHICY